MTATKLTGLIAGAAMLSCGSAEAEMSVQNVISNFHRDAQISTIYINGVLNGLLASNAMVVIFGGAPLWYCKPNDLVLSSAQSIDIVERFVAQNPKTVGDQFSVVMILAMRDKFPCKKD